MIRRIILLLMGAAACVPAQTAAERLASTEPSELAWGAHLAAEGQQKDLIPAILPLLKVDNSGVRLAAIDALIRLDADVPEEELTPLLKNYWLDSALIFLSKDPKRHAGFLMILLDRAMDDTQWDALNDILTVTVPPGYAGRLLKAWELRVVACVGTATCSTWHDMIADTFTTARIGSIEPGFPSRFAYILGRWGQRSPP